MRHKSTVTLNKSLLDMIEHKDLEWLLLSDPASLLGHIMQLNGLPRYHNRLDAIQLVVRIEELRSRGTGPRATFR
ncbi:MAG: hypothetical protein ABIQ75_01035 [Flavobacteriales bacterium]